MKRNEFIKNATIGLAAIVLSGKYDFVTNENEDIDFIIQYINTKVDFTYVPKNMDLTEKALTAFIQGDLSKRSAVKILMYTDGYSEEEALYEINNLGYATKEQQEYFENEEDDYEKGLLSGKNKTNSEDYPTPGGGFGFGSMEFD